MLQATEYRITQKHSLYQYLSSSCSLANSLENAVLFRLRQLMTGLKKEHPTANEQSVIDEAMEALPEMNAARKAANDRKAEKYRRAVGKNLKLPKDKRADIKEPKYSQPFAMPTAERWLVSYEFLEALMKATANPDFAAMPSVQAAQDAVRSVRHDMDAGLKAIRAYAKDPSKFTSRPSIPHYHKKGGQCTVMFTNQDCRIKDGRLCFPNTKESLKAADRPGRLKQVAVKPWHGIFIVTTVMEVPDVGPMAETPRRIMSIDVGVENTAAITNNAGMPCLLFKGGALKSINQRFNKKAARMVSEQTLATGKKFAPTPEYHALCLGREARVHDLLHKDAKMIVSYAILWKADTIVFGRNPSWKQGTDMGHKNNQEFVQIPFAYLGQCLRSLCTANGIRFIEQEESYTSKASFLDNDPIPVYEAGRPCPAVFSGRRAPTRYKGMYRKGGFRGLYVSGDGTAISSDLNGSANVGRKCFPGMYAWEGAGMPDFSRVIVITHPELWERARNQEMQLRATHAMSRSKQKRLSRKAKRAGGMKARQAAGQAA